MCDIKPLRNWLLASLSGILVAIGLIVAAAIANNSFFGAPASPGLMITAGFVTAFAVVFVGLAINALDAYFRCLMGRCEGQCSNLRNLLNGVRVVLGIQAAACFVAAGIAWIPWAGAIPMYVILGALFLQLVLLVSGIAFVNALARCGRPLAA
jgi:hypothetical protein